MKGPRAIHEIDSHSKSDLFVSTTHHAVRREAVEYAPVCGWLAELALPLTVLGCVTAYGWIKLSQPESAGPTLKVALVQPNIPQTAIWNPNERTNRFRKLVELSEQALASKPDLLVWPESALPNLLTRFNPTAYHAITNLVLKHRVWMILGANDAQTRKNGRDPGKVDFFISGFLVDPSGQLVGKYHKRQLVMFGEYMPLSRWLPFLNSLRANQGGFTRGQGPVPFILTEHQAKISVLICSEDVFPHLVREYVEADTDFLLNLTNDGWFGESAVQWQHAIDALFRAIENGVPLVRCTNNGLTCWIDARGRMHEVQFAGSRNVYSAGFKIVQIPLRPKGQDGRMTFYQRYGDWFGWSCVGWTGIMLARRLLPVRRGKERSK